MLRLCQSELHKFFHSRLHCVLLLILLLFPILQLAFTLHIEAQQPSAQIHHTVVSVKEAKLIADDLRRNMQETVQKSWVTAREQESVKRISAIRHSIRRTGTAFAPWKCGMPSYLIRRHLPSYVRI